MDPQFDFGVLSAQHDRLPPPLPAPLVLCLGRLIASPRISFRLEPRLLRYLVALFFLICASSFPTTHGSQHTDAEHITAILGESVVLNCPVSQPETPYIIQWKRQHHKIPIYIWYGSYDPHVEDNYKDRVSRVNPSANYGLASLNLTSVLEDDQGWYECNVYYLDRSGVIDNGTWVHLDVHAPPRFVTTPDEVTYVNIGDSIILNCEAQGTPTPEIMWFRDDKPVRSSKTVGIINDGTELRINKIRDQDIGDYVCAARNAEGKIHHVAKVVIAGGAVIVNPPQNATHLEGEKAVFNCEAKALPGNVTVVWKRENVAIDQLSWLETRAVVRRDGSMVINPTSADDGGIFTCEVSNGIGTTQKASAYLNVEYPARVTYTPTVQYLPFRQQGIIKCFIRSNPEVQFVTWLKEKRLFDPNNEEGVLKLNNGSLLITKVNQGHQGRYSCTPYNQHTTAGSSGDMEVLVRDPPMFSPRPEAVYQSSIGDDVTMVCGAKGSPKPSVTWRRRDGQNLPRDRAHVNQGNLTIKGVRKPDHTYYECVVKNEIMEIVAGTQLLVEGTTPHAPYNITTETNSFYVKLSWLPGYAGGSDYHQNYTVFYRYKGTTTWSQIEVKPPGSTFTSIQNLSPNTTFEFQVQGTNHLGEGMFTDIFTATTKEYDYEINILPKDPYGRPYFPFIKNPEGPKPDPPINLEIQRIKDGWLLTWDPPEHSPVPVQYYHVEYRGGSQWNRLSKENIVDDTSLKIKTLGSNREYEFRVFSNSMVNYTPSKILKYTTPVITKEKEITAAVVGGLLFFIVAIILSVCMVKICNKRKRKKQEKEFESHILYDSGYSAAGCRPGEAAAPNGMAPSPLPYKKTWRRRISGVTKLWNDIIDYFVDDGLLDTTDSRRPLRSSFDARRSSQVRSGDPRMREGLRLYDSFGKPLSPIYRTMEGKFVLDKDSEEGGFTSPRRQIRSLTRRRHISPFRFQSRDMLPHFAPRRPDIYADGYYPVPVEGGVYDVRAGTTHALIHPAPESHDIVAGLTPADYPDNYPSPLIDVQNTLSPEFGQHIIVDSQIQSPPYGRQKIRSSSPRQYVNEWNRLAHLASFSEVSSVKQPSSVERSFPSTLFSSFHTSLQKTPSTVGTPLNASALLRRHPHSDFDRVIREQEMLLEKNRLVLRQKELRQIPTTSPDVIPPHLLYPTNEGYYYPQYLPSWVSPRSPVVISRPSAQALSPRYESSRTPVYHPPYREPLFIISESSAIAPHYVNVSTRRGVPLYQQVPARRPPYYFFKPPADSSKPLATSSPPRSPSRSSSEKRKKSALAISQAKSKSSKKPQRDTSIASESSDEHPASYTRDRLQKAIGRVKSGDIRTHERPHSAPSFSSMGTADNAFMETTRRIFSKAKKGAADPKSGDVSQEKSDELSTEFSPSSSSGFGSKNTSQQQSSQSGQSASALGLDASRLDTSDLMKSFPESQEWEVGPHYQDMRINVLRHPHPYPVIVSTYEANIPHRIYPHEFPVQMGSRNFAVSPNLIMGIPRPKVIPSNLGRRMFPLYQNIPSAVAEVEPYQHMFKPKKQRALPPVSAKPPPRPPPAANLPPQQSSTSGAAAVPPTPLDISVDDHYEFDTLLSPMPEDSDSFWSRSQSRQGDRGLSDSEVEATSRKTDHESMEARVAAMKQEFHQYRQKQAKKRSDRKLESVC